ncbi:hypothetical protein LCGC14_2517930 [marine sediment metagenome]|uniref:DUF2695 domain-containing protein n=1 Tax=marine sediment metagenome TaxID=412755 RepID=A0A0F9BKA1_9ZZZZ
MKKERVIIIKNPQLQKVRNELRALIKLWKEDIESSLLHSDFKKKHAEISRLHSAFLNSICMCRFCGNFDRDMIFAPDMRQWLCINCNSRRVYFKNLHQELKNQMSKEKIREFLERLAGGDGIRLSRSGSGCKGHIDSKRILDQMGIRKETQEIFLELCDYYDGHCDCEILLNAKPWLLGEY